MATRDRDSRRRSKGEPFTVRFAPATQAAIEAEARRTKRTRTALVEELADEALRTRVFPGIAFHGSHPHREAWLIDAGLEVWELCELSDRYPDVETLVSDFPALERRHVDVALSYREAYPGEIDEAIAENNHPADELRGLYPFVRDVRADADPPR